MSRVDLGMPAFGKGNLFAKEGFPTAARRELANPQLRSNLRHATSTIRAKRTAVTGELPDWEELREAGSALKQSVLARLPELLSQFEKNVTNRGGTVHWAKDASEANSIIHSLVASERCGRGSQGEVNGDSRNRNERIP